ncbi:hypothetical protein NPIL_560911 [Nephila pilipes]|uniref:Uncharacterized protein n=1 Tax=Nephila pilipes TaxID=299642 RepID=A0A8X6TRL2_NEPPI|nr:hypothetical protein NPIL_560911 [Nephila pilipes]
MLWIPVYSTDSLKFSCLTYRFVIGAENCCDSSSIRRTYILPPKEKFLFVGPFGLFTILRKVATDLPTLHIEIIPIGNDARLKYGFGDFVNEEE